MGNENDAFLLLRAVTNFGWYDVSKAAQWLDESDSDYSEFADFVTEYCNDTETPLTSLDLPAMALEYIAERAGASDLRVQIYSNFLDSWFDTGEEEAGEILYRVDENERNAAWRWLIQFTQAVEPETEPIIE